MPQKTETESPQGIRDAVASSPAADHSASAPPGDVAAARRRRSIPAWVIIAAIIVIVGAAIFVWNYYSTFETTDDAQVDGHINPISARVGGYIQKVNVDDNQYVDAGTVLAQIDPKDYQVAVDKAEADLASAEATAMAAGRNVPITTVNSASQLESANADVTSTIAGIRGAQGQADAAKAALVQAEANDAKAQADLARYKQLVAKQEISQQQYDQAVAAAAASAAGVV
ncbi:MAG: biotin/lipoyl-binding protein, partial [Candidatus Acidiferrales bacterium]